MAKELCTMGEKTSGDAQSQRSTIGLRYYNFYLTLSHQCNLHCIYCGEEEMHADQPRDCTYSPESLKKFLDQYQPFYITLYGGEPCLRPELIYTYLDGLQPARVILHTNGTLLRTLADAHLYERIGTIILSIDGSPGITDFYRGKGVYQQIKENILWLLGTSWEGKIYARMTVSEQTKFLDNEVLHLLDIPWCNFSGIAWQLNALFKCPGYKWNDFEAWATTYYAPALDRLSNIWSKNFVQNKIMPIIPFNEIAVSLFTGEQSHLRCGAGWRDFAVATDGSILPCPIAGMESLKVGHLSHTDNDIRNKCSLGSHCRSCDNLRVCGGRCLYASFSNEWGPDGFLQVCGCTNHLIECVKSKLTLINEALNRNPALWDILSQTDHHGCEVIP